jgi:hypothetical protein
MRCIAMDVARRASSVCMFRRFITSIVLGCGCSHLPPIRPLDRAQPHQSHPLSSSCAYCLTGQHATYPRGKTGLHHVPLAIDSDPIRNVNTYIYIQTGLASRLACSWFSMARRDTANIAASLKDYHKHFIRIYTAQSSVMV